MAKISYKASLIHFFSWALYDCGNSSFSAIIQTFIFAEYFTEQVATNDINGSVLWGLVNGLSALFIGIAGPILGAIADNGNSRKTWIFLFSYLCILSTCLLWFIKPDSSYTLWALVTFSSAVIGSELAFIFYNGMLAEIAPPKFLGRWSGWGWAFGYIGGVLSLLLSFGLFMSDTPWIQTNKIAATPIRSTFLLAGIWYAIFSIPLFLFVPDPIKKGKPLLIAIKAGLNDLKRTIKHIHEYKHILRFLIARNFYMDGLTSVFVFAGVYAASFVGMQAREILIFGIVTNIAAAFGVVIFSFVDDWIGGKKTILISLVGLTLTTAGLLFVKTQETFWVIGLALGVFVGPIQSASRSFMARIAPENLRNEMFGFFALSGKATAFAGPLLVGWLISMTQNGRAGIWVTLCLFTIGLLLMIQVPEDKQDSL